MIRVVHISTSCQGGAGRAAFRLHQGLQPLTDMRSTFISADHPDSKQNPDHVCIEPPKHGLHHRLLNKLGFPVLNFHKNLKLTSGLRGEMEMFSMPATDHSPENLAVVQQADIIHLHWISGFINYQSFFGALKHKPMVWTLHDMNPFMGGFHYLNDRHKNPSWHPLDDYLKKVKQSAVRQVENLTIVSPSRWLYDEAVRSGFFNEQSRFRQISYGLDLEKFHPGNKKTARQMLKADNDLPCLLVIAQDMRNSRKGFDLFVRAVRQIKICPFRIICIGKNLPPIQGNCKLISLGPVSSDHLLAQAYAAADLVVIPSLEDNLPNVMLEAWACGIPVLGFKVGGLAERIIPRLNGLLAKSVDALSLQIELERFLQNPGHFDSRQIRDFAIKNFSLQGQAKKYREVYKAALNDDDS